MFREVLLDSTERDFHRFILRQKDGSLVDCRMLRLTFGVKPSPFLATQVLRTLAKSAEVSHPEAARAILQDFYVDDPVGSRLCRSSPRSPCPALQPAPIGRDEPQGVEVQLRRSSRADPRSTERSPSIITLHSKSCPEGSRCALGCANRHTPHLHSSMRSTTRDHHETHHRLWHSCSFLYPRPIRPSSYSGPDNPARPLAFISVLGMKRCPRITRSDGTCSGRTSPPLPTLAFPYVSLTWTPL